MYDQGAQLEKRGRLQLLITNYPKFHVCKYGVGAKFVRIHLLNGIIHFVFRNLPTNCRNLIRGFAVRFLANNFSRFVAQNIPNDVNVFIGLSLYALDGVRQAKRYGAVTVVDSGSIYLPIQQEIIDEERKKFQLPLRQRIKSWAIEKQNSEFYESDYIFLPSAFAKSTFVRAGFDKNKILVNPYGVDLSMFKPTDKSDTTFRVLYVGGMTLAKGIHYLIKGFIDADIQNSELVMVGPGWPNPDILACLTKMNVVIDERIRFEGRKPQTELYKFYGNATVFVFPSLCDGYGLVVPQALSCGSPVIVSKNAGSSDVVTDGYNGYVVDPCNADGIKRALLKMVNDPSLAQKMRKNAVESVKQGLSWDDYGARLDSNLDNMTNCKSLTDNRGRL